MALAIGSWTQQNSQWCYFAWENLQWGFCDVGCCSLFIVVLHSLMSLHFRAISPCHRHSTLASQACEGLHQLWALPWLLSIAFAFSSSAMVVSGNFLPTGVFYLTLLSPTFLTLPAFIKASLGAGSSSLRFAGLHDDPRNTDLANLFDSQQSTIFIYRRIRF